MELILKEDISGLGFKDDIVQVKNGYGRNYLIPKGLAQIATESAKKILAENLKQRAFKEKSQVEQAHKLAQDISKIKIKIKSKVATADKLFGSVGSQNLADALKEKGYELDKDVISIPGKTIKRTGSHLAKIRFHREVSVEFPFEVIPE
ncbi:MAG: 50S ribosomal protein L9 [Flavobacteriaceae bacterium]|nr:50S ribosomal protein L9 [Flavobacteriaceae bacterium]MCY4266972.1 50S ribosomal protein L9 [Flavobacteriaceae bacterium]MCY4299018.1 50S ribosomal protein L9 [Flavobacteriaceae bacterium]